MMIPLLHATLPHPYLEKSQKTLDDFSCVGLRTLVFGCRIITQSQFDEFSVLYNEAITSSKKKEKLNALCRLVEKDISLLGVTAIKDHLQEKVSESIQRFIEANIKVWMITGDKLQTAESIAFSAGLFHSNMHVFTLSESDKSNFFKHVKDLKRRMQKVKEGTKKGIVIDISQLSKRKDNSNRFHIHEAGEFGR